MLYVSFPKRVGACEMPKAVGDAEEPEKGALPEPDSDSDQGGEHDMHDDEQKLRAFER